MSTILKALRRLEEDRPAASEAEAARADGRTPSGDPKTRVTRPAVDPRSADDLRARILAEEAAAQAAPGVTAPASRAAAAADADPMSILGRWWIGPNTGRPLIMAVAVLSILGLGLGGYALLFGEALPSTPAEVAPQAAAASGLATAPLDPDPDTSRRLAANRPEARPPRLAAAPIGASGSASTTSGSIASIDSSARPTASPGATTQSPPADSSPSEPRGRALPPIVAVVTSDERPSEGGSRAIAAQPAESKTPPPKASPPRPSVAASAAGARPNSNTSAQIGSPPRGLREEVREPAREPMPLAAVTPTPASTRAVQSAAARPKPTPSERSPAQVSARAPASSPTKQPTKSRAATPSESSATPRPSSDAAPAPSRSKPATRAEPKARDVELIERRGLPDITVVRTSWHPSADRRSTKVRLESTNDVLNLREGDAVGGYIIQEISPSAVVFSTGEIEVRRRVGESGDSR